MCDQTEINYLDGDIVWVKLGSAWWPGQVAGFDNLPDVLQAQIKKKPHIAAVKFFQEDSYELVRNIQQIYKYNCRHKDDFIKKGLDKYRSRSKDGTNYMDKFPGDVETAEKLTNGDPDILSSSKFCEQKKPDISSLFGEKKLPKRKKDKNETNRKSLIGNNDTRKIIQPRFIGRKSDHEIRIRQQNTKNSNPSTPNLNDSTSSSSTKTPITTATTTTTPLSSSSIYTCPHCDYTSTRLNVIICHNKSHRNNNNIRPSITPVRRPSPLKSHSVGACSINTVKDSGEIQKRKYTRKNKSLSIKLKDDKIVDTPKRKYNKGVEKPTKKKKNDPEIKEKHLRETLLADWEDGSEDGNMDIDLDNSASDDFLTSPSKNNDNEKTNNDDKGIDNVDKSSSSSSSSPIKDSIISSDKDIDVDKQQPHQRSPLLKKFKKFDDLKTNSSSSDEKNDQKSKLSCFDFDEDEEPQPALLPPTRKITRVFGEKNKSRKKELIKEFTRTSQAFANEKINDEDDLLQKQSIEEIKNSDNEKIDDKIKDTVDDNNDDDDFNDKINREINETTELVAKIAETTTNLVPSKSEISETIEFSKVDKNKEDVEEKEIDYQNDENVNETNEITENIEDATNHDNNMIEDLKESNDVEKDVEETNNDTDIEIKIDEENEERNDKMDEKEEEQTVEINEDKKEQNIKIDEEKEEQDFKMNEEKDEQDFKINEEKEEQDFKINQEKDEQDIKMNEDKGEQDVEMDAEKEEQDVEMDEKKEDQDVEINEEKEEQNDKVDEEIKEQNDKIDEIMQEDKVKKIDEPVVDDMDHDIEINNENKNIDLELTKEKEEENQNIEADKEEIHQDTEINKEKIDKVDEEEKIQEIETTEQENNKQIENNLEENQLNLTEAIVSESEIKQVEDLKILQSNSEEIINSPKKSIESEETIIESEIKESNDEKFEEKTEQIDKTIDDEMKIDNIKEKKEHIEDNIQESRMTIEAEEETLIATTSGTLSNFNKNISQVNILATPTKIELIDKKTITPDVPEKRRRGRPRKTPIPIHMSGNGDSLIKIEEPKTPGTPDSQDFDRKTSESDGEKSNTGRRRKPNKKYLESDMYSPSPGNRTPRTDDSQSEAEDKSITIKKRGKRGRKPTKKLIPISIEEYEFSDQTLDSAEESMIGSPIKIQDINKKSDTLSPVNLTELLVNTDIEIRDNTTNDNNDDNKIDKLPPKKSQIKKFESSQYEFFSSNDKEETTKIIETTTTPETTIHTEILSENNINQIFVESKVVETPQEQHTMETDEISNVNETVIEDTVKNIIIENDKKLIEEKVVVEPTKSFSENLEINEENKSMIVDTNIQIDEEKEKIAHEIVQDNNVIVEEHVETIEEVETLSEVIKEPIIEEKNDEVSLSIEEKVIETTEVTDKIEEVVETTVVADKIEEEVVETTEVLEKIEEEVIETTEVPEKIEEEVIETTEVPEKIEEEVIETTEVPEQIKEIAETTEVTEKIEEVIETTIISDSIEEVVETTEVAEKVEQVSQKIEDEIPVKNENIEQVVVSIEETPVRIEEIPVKVEEKMAHLLEQVEAMDHQTEEIVTTMPDNKTTEIIETKEIPLTIIQESQKLQEKIISPKKNEPVINKIITVNQNISETQTQKTQELIMPVKKREKPRIIENVTLKQPMQILKTKLLEKPRSQKHKLDNDMMKKNRSTPPTKIMRIDPQLIKTSRKSGKSGTGELTLSKKLEVLKADEAKNEAINEQVLGNTSGIISLSTTGSQGYQNMELDIESIPFVYQEDLNPETIKQMPDMTSTIITSNPTIQTTTIQQQQQPSSALTLIQTTQPSVTPQKTCDNTGELSPSKKKIITSSPAILKNKTKAKPTITSVKTLMPGSLNQLKFGQNASGKALPIMTQKSGTPGKYIILQTSNAQQMTPNKTGTSPKILIQQNKTPNQIIHQDNKVVILTSPQSGQSKMLPLKVQKNVPQKKFIKGNQVYTQISKSQILPKTDTSSSSSLSLPTTSKIITGQKMISTTQGNIVTSKVFTSVAGGMQKIYVQSDGSKFISKGGQLYTTINTGGLTKIIAGQKTLVTKQGTIVGTVAGQSGSKTILSPIPQGNKQTLTHNLQSSKGTVLTPITGQQVKAIAAKAAPPKTQKIQFIQQQQQQQQKLPITSGTNISGMRVVANKNLKNTGQQIIIQNSQILNQQNTLTKISPQGKKMIRQNIVGQSGKSPQLLSQSSSGSLSPQITKTKLLTSTTPTMQKINTPKGRTLKTLHNKGIIQKIQDTTSTSTLSTSPKTNVSSTITKMTGSPKMVNLKTTPVTKNTQKSLISPKPQQKQQQLKSISSPMASSSSTTSTSTSTSTSSSNIHTIQSSPPPLQEIKKSDIEETVTTVTTVPSAAITLSSQPPPLVSAATITVAPAITTVATTTITEAAVATTTTTATATVETNEIITKQNTEVNVQPQTEVLIESNKTSLDEQKVTATQPQIIMLPTSSADGSPSYSLYIVDEQGIANPMDSSALLALDGIMTNSDGTIDPNSSNFVLQFDEDTQIQTTTDATQMIQQQQSSATQIVSTNSNHDILAAALANSDFQGEISIPETSSTSVLSTDINETNLNNQSILQSTLVPPSTEKLTSVQETWTRPIIMTPLEVPSNIVPTLTQNQTTNLSSIPFEMNYISDNDNTTVQLPGNSMPDISEIVDTQNSSSSTSTTTTTATTQCLSSNETIITAVSTSIPSTSNVSYSVSISDNIGIEMSSGVQTTPSMPIIDDTFTDNDFNKKIIKNKINNKTNKNKNINKNKKIDKNKQITDLSIDNNKLSLKNNEKIINQQPETSQKILDMPIVGDIIDDKNNDNKNLLNSDVVDSCMPVIDNSSVLTESTSNNIQSTDKTNDDDNNDDEKKITKDNITTNDQEAETSDKKLICDNIESMEVDDIVYDAVEEIKQTAESSNVQEIEQMECTFNQDTIDTEQNQEIPSQSFEQFKIIENNESPSQSVEKSTDSREPSQSEADELMEISNEPPSQSFENSALHEASQSYQENSNSNINSRSSDQVDDPSFPTQSYDVGKIDNITENIEQNCELSQEGNIPSQSNDVDIDGIGTSSFTNQGNDDETASSSYVPETPEAQERDQDQESAISTSSYEIPPSDEINIASSSLIPDTSGNEHTNIHDNGIPEIPTSSYNLNPDSSSTHIDSQVPSSSFEDQVIIEQNVSTSYDVPISMPSIEDNSSSGNFVSESGDQTNEPTSYYTRNPEDITSEASQSYFVREATSPSYNEQNVSPSYYDTPQASQSFYSSQEIDRTAEQSSSSSSSRNVEASQSFYQDNSDELRLRQQQGEATPTYYPLDNDNSPIERHDLVESSVPATRPTER